MLAGGGAIVLVPCVVVVLPLSASSSLLSQSKRLLELVLGSSVAAALAVVILQRLLARIPYHLRFPVLTSHLHHTPAKQPFHVIEEDVKVIVAGTSSCTPPCFMKQGMIQDTGNEVQG
jgi:hypothetical protein